MILSIQLKTILVSIIYGFVFGIFFRLLRKLIYNKSKIISFFSTFIIFIISTCIYFYILLSINNGYYHIYEIMCLFIGYYISKYLIVKCLKR